MASLAAPSSSVARSSWPDKYDKPIKHAVELWWPGEDWRLWKAQLWQESRLDPNARSPVGALGIAQFMPATWEETLRQMGWELVERTEAEPAIEAGAYYMSRLRRTWKGNHPMAAASYNAGAGNITKAWVLCKRPEAWDDVARCLPKVTGRHAAETITYVERIYRWFRQMVLE